VLDTVPSNTFSLYDHVLDTAVLFDAVPRRFADLGLSAVDTYFAAARGRDGVPPLELTKWFDTNYHYLVPELRPESRFALVGDKPLAEFREALELGVRTRPVLLGPVTFLLLAKSTVEGFDPLDLLDPLLDRYVELLDRLAEAGAEWVQLDEPAFVADRTESELSALRRAYTRLSATRPNILVAAYFGDLGPALPVLAETSIDAIAVDLVAGCPDAVGSVLGLRDKTLVAGVVDGRNVWRTDLGAALATCASLLGSIGSLAVSTSCSLLHVPYDLDIETDLDPAVVARLAFARQKVAEVALLGRALREDGLRLDRAAVAAPAIDDRVRARIAALRPEHRTRTPYAERERVQRERLGLPPLPTTTIGSFPQTADVRKARAELVSGGLDAEGYAARMRRHAMLCRRNGCGRTRTAA